MCVSILCLMTNICVAEHEYPYRLEHFFNSKYESNLSPTYTSRTKNSTIRLNKNFLPWKNFPSTASPGKKDQLSMGSHDHSDFAPKDTSLDPPSEHQS